MSFFRGGTEFPSKEEKPLPDEELAVLEKLAKKVVEWQMTTPAIIFLESVKPMNYIGSQALVFFEPIVQSIFNFKDYDTFRQALEKRESIEIMLQMIEKHDATAHEREKRIKKYRKQLKKNWKWYQRYLGIFQPKVEYPDDVIYGPEGKPEDTGDNGDPSKK
jgi:hypothetical protein